MTPYETLLHLAFPKPDEAGRYLTPLALGAYTQFRQAQPAERSFRFEQWRLGSALSLLKLLADLGDHDDSRRAADVLHRTLATARTPGEIDRLIAREAELFDQLYNNLFVNEQGEALLDLFARTLDADRPEALSAVVNEAVLLARELDFSRSEEEEEDE